MPVIDSTVRTRNAEIRLSDSGGQGLPVLLIHGSGASSEVFARQFDSPLADLFRLIAIDLPGHGSSSDAADPSTAYTLGGLTATVVEILATLEIRRTAVFGWSLGGHVAIELMAKSDLVAGLMLSGAPPVSRGPLGMLRGFQVNWDMLLASKRNFSGRDAERFSRLCFGDEDGETFLAAIRRADGRLRAIFSRSLMRGDGADQRRTVERATVPLAVINGADDPFIRLGYFDSLAIPTLWRGQNIVIGGAGHAPFWQRPETFNLLLLRFLADVAVSEADQRQERIHPQLRA